MDRKKERKGSLKFVRGETNLYRRFISRERKVIRRIRRKEAPRITVSTMGINSVLSISVESAESRTLRICEKERARAEWLDGHVVSFHLFSFSC